MQPSASFPKPPSAPFVESGTMWGARQVRSAVSRLRSLAAVALGISVLILLLGALNWGGVLQWAVPSNGESVTDWWSFGLQVGALATIGITIVALFVAAVVFAVTGVAAWRRGVLAMVASASEHGAAHAKAVLQARQDHSLTLWMMVVFVAAAMAASILTSGLGAVLSYAHWATLPSGATGIASSLAGSVVLVAAYHFGSRNLVVLLSGLSSTVGRERLVRGRSLLLVGAVVGIGGAFGVLSWVVETVVVASLAFIVLGANDLLEAYDLWLAGARGSTVPVGASRPSVS